jgi:hypothetical protein
VGDLSALDVYGGFIAVTGSTFVRFACGEHVGDEGVPNRIVMGVLHVREHRQDDGDSA